MTRMRSGLVLAAFAAVLALTCAPAAPAASDVTPPSTPSGVQAWRNAQGWVRVSWTGSADGESGVHEYVVRRITDGSPAVIAVVTAGNAYFDDHDDLGSSAVSYTVSAGDRAGNPSPQSVPAPLRVDTRPPTSPRYMWISATSGDDYGMPYYYYGDTSHVRFAADWYPSADGTSGVAGYEVRYGPVKDVPIYSKRTSEANVLVESEASSAKWWFSVVAEDRAGNVSTAAPAAFARFVAVDRVAGRDRTTTSLLASAKAFPSAEHAVFVAASAPADAISAAALAGVLDAPILLAGPGPLPQATRDELARLGVTDAYVVGGVGSVSSSTVASIDEAIPGGVRRIGGTDRNDAAIKVAREVWRLRGVAGQRAYVVDGRDLATAVIVGPAAYASGDPVLFADATRLLAGSADDSLTAAVVVGAKTAVWANAERSGLSVSRIAGSSLPDTSRRFADWASRQRILRNYRPALAAAMDIPDGVTAASFAGSTASPLLLTNTNWRDYRERWDYFPSWLEARAAAFDRLTLIGGTGVLSDDVRYTAFRALSSSYYYYPRWGF